MAQRGLNQPRRTLACGVHRHRCQAVKHLGLLIQTPDQFLPSPGIGHPHSRSAVRVGQRGIHPRFCGGVPSGSSDQINLPRRPEHLIHRCQAPIHIHRHVSRGIRCYILTRCFDDGCLPSGKPPQLEVGGIPLVNPTGVPVDDLILHQDAVRSIPKEVGSHRNPIHPEVRSPLPRV